MTFARPEALWLLALALPVVALFLVRPRARRTTVGSVLLWRRVQAKQAARASVARLEQLLSLLLHVAALAAVVLAIARPLGATVEPRRLVAVLDASGSMGARLDGRTRFEAALARARELAASLGPEDELGFVLAGTTPRVLLAPSLRARAPESALEGARLEGGKTDLRAALALAYTLLDATPAGRGREVWLLSDGAAPELANEPRPRPPAGTRLRYLRFGSPGDGSVGVVSFAARELPGKPGELEIAASVASSLRERARVKATLSLDGEPVVALEPFEIEPGERRVLPARRIEVEKGGVLALRVEAAGDRLPLDDQAWLVVPGARRPSVHLEGDIPLEGTQLPRERDIPFEGTARGEIPFVRAVLESDDGIRLARDGADVVVIASDRVPDDPPRAALLVGEDAARAASARPAWGIADRGEASAPRPGVLDAEHPVLRHVLLESALFARARRVEAAASWKTLAGEPPLVLVREDAQGRRAVLLPFAPGETDLVLRRAWPLLVANSLRWLASSGPREAAPTVRAGEVARVSVPRGTTRATVVSPSGERTPVPVEESGEVASIAFPFTREPGVYRVVGGRVDPVVASPPRGEETAARAADETALGRFAVSLLDEGESRIAARRELGLGEQVALEAPPRPGGLETPALLGSLAVLLLALEGYLFHRRGLA